MFHSVALALAALVAMQHVAFLVLEMFLWDHPVGRRVFGLDPEFAKHSKGLAANQGLYNGFLAAGLGWGLVTSRTDVLLFFLICVVVAGVFGAVTVKRSILYVQGVPAGLALLALLVA